MSNALRVNAVATVEALVHMRVQLPVSVQSQHPFQ